MKKLEPFYERTNGPVHNFFGLTYANYLVLPRSLLQSLPLDIQNRLVAVLDDIEELAGDLPQPDSYRVNVIVDNKFAKDPLPHYRHAPDLLGAKE